MSRKRGRERVLAFFADVIERSCRKDTSADENGWSAENPTWGHCAVAALWIQEMWGGDLLRYDLAGTPFSAMRSHYRNRLPDGSIVDFTNKQFGGKISFSDLPDPVVRAREEVLDPVKYPATVERYSRFRQRAMRVAVSSIRSGSI